MTGSFQKKRTAAVIGDDEGNFDLVDDLDDRLDIFDVLGQEQAAGKIAEQAGRQVTLALDALAHPDGEHGGRHHDAEPADQQVHVEDVPLVQPGEAAEPGAIFLAHRRHDQSMYSIPPR